MSKIWKFEAICHNDHNDDIESYFKTFLEGKLETIIEYILNKKYEYGYIREAIYQNLMFLKNDENVELNMENFKEVLDDNTNPNYEINLFEIDIDIVNMDEKTCWINGCVDDVVSDCYYCNNFICEKHKFLSDESLIPNNLCQNCYYMKD